MPRRGLRQVTLARRANSKDGHLTDSCDISHLSITRSPSIAVVVCRLAQAPSECPCATARRCVIMILYIWLICKLNQASLCARQKRRQPISLMPVTDPAVSSERARRTKRLISACARQRPGWRPCHQISHPPSSFYSN